VGHALEADRRVEAVDLVGLVAPVGDDAAEPLSTVLVASGAAMARSACWRQMVADAAGVASTQMRRALSPTPFAGRGGTNAPTPQPPSCCASSLPTPC
jgi:hypothetical protein